MYVQTEGFNKHYIYISMYVDYAHKINNTIKVSQHTYLLEDRRKEKESRI